MTSLWAFPSIRARLLLSVLSIQIVGAAVATSLVVAHERRQAYAAFDASLGEQAAALRTLIEAPEEANGAVVFHKEFLALPKGDRFLLVDATGRKIAGAEGWRIPHPLPSASRGILSLAVGGTRYRALVLQRIPLVDIEDATTPGTRLLTLLYAVPVEPVEIYIHQVAMQSIAACLVLLALSNIVSSWALTRGLRPLRELATGAEKIDIGQWTLPEIDESRSYRELKPLADALAALVDRLHAAFVRERQFFGDAAHEMKSAVAIVRSTLQFALQKERSAADYRGGLQEALADTVRLQNLVTGMLDLARVESIAPIGVPSERCRTEAHASAQRVVDRFQPLSVERDVRVEVKSEEREAWVRIPEDDLLTVLSNLVENAILYSEPGRTVGIAIHLEADTCRIDVSDRGCGVPPAAIPHIFERFYRGDASRARATGGAGLGLAIAKALVVRACGTITARSEQDKGSVFSVSLPARAAPKA